MRLVAIVCLVILFSPALCIAESDRADLSKSEEIELRILIDQYIDYFEGTEITGYEVMLKEEDIPQESTKITQQQFYMIGKLFYERYPEEGEKAADVLYELLSNEVGIFSKDSYTFMTNPDDNGREELILIKAYAQIIPDHFLALYKARLEADEAKRQLEESKRQADEAKRQLEESKRQADEATRQADEATRKADALEKAAEWISRSTND